MLLRARAAKWVPKFVCEELSILETSAIRVALSVFEIHIFPTPNHVIVMSTAKRSRRRQTEVRTASPLPSSKRLKTTTSAHVPTKGGLGFLVDEDERVGRKLDARLTNGVPNPKTTRVDESHSNVATSRREEVEDAPRVNGTPQDIIDISSGEEQSSEYESEDGGDGGADVRDHSMMDGGLQDEEDAQLGAEDIAEGMEDEQRDMDMEDADAQEPSFGDILQARHPEPIDVHSAFPDPMAERSAMVATPSNTALAAPTGTSLVTVLTQALKTNDKEMLESCFRVTDQPSIRSTAQRLQSQHVSTLIQRIAERIHRRPGRTGSLLIWVQHALIAHGGYLATQPDTMRKLKALSQVMQERAKGLQPLFHLKGKLDLLSGQLELRRSVFATSHAMNGNEEDDEDAVLYVEGQAEGWSDSDEGEDEEHVTQKMLEPPIRKPKAQTATPRSDLSDGGDDDSDDEMPNGVAHSSDEEDEDEDEQQGEGLFDDEAEETDNDDEEDPDSDEEADSEPDEEDDEDEPSDDGSEEAAVRPPKPAMLNRKR